MKTPILMTAALVAATMLSARPAAADVTAFFGTDITPNSRLTLGAAAGVGLSVLGVEGEYASTTEDTSTGAPALKTVMINGLLQSPVPIVGVRPYFTIGAGFYHAALSTIDYGHSGVGTNIGGGVKVTLIGPVRVRLDYRAFALGGGALFTPAHRLYAGLTIGF